MMEERKLGREDKFPCHLCQRKFTLQVALKIHDMSKHPQFTQ